jgi:hypothetical protein
MLVGAACRGRDNNNALLPSDGTIFDVAMLWLVWYHDSHMAIVRNAKDTKSLKLLSCQLAHFETNTAWSVCVISMFLFDKC